MKKSINYWSFPGVLAGKAEFELRECMKLAKDAGFDAIELALEEKGEINLNSSRQDIDKIVEMSKEVGIELSSLASGLLWDYSLTSSETKIREKAQDIVKKMLELASYLGVDTVLVIPGAVDIFFNPQAEVVPYDVAYQRSLDSLKKCTSVAEECKVTIGIENVWNKFLLSPLEIRDFVDKIDSEYVGVYFDVGNTMLTGYPEQWIRILNKRIKKVHIKDFRSSVANVNGFVDLLEGDVNWEEVIKTLKDIGYNDYLTAEILPAYSHHPKALLYNTSKSMDFILGKE